MVVFKIVQCDAGAQDLIGFARSQAQRIIDAGVKDFTRNWLVGDFTVIARCNDFMKDQIVKLWLIGGVNGLVSIALPNPVAYRGVFVGEASSYVTMTYEETLSEYTGSGTTFTRTYVTGNLVCRVNGVVVGSVPYEQIVENTLFLPSGPNIASHNQTTNSRDYLFPFIANPPRIPKPSPYALHSATLDTFNPFPSGGPSTYTFSEFWTTPFDDAIAEALGNSSSQVRNVVMTSDGDELASEPKVNTPDQHILYVFDAFVWSGAGYADMFDIDNVNGTRVFDHKLTFEVPEDCIYPINDYPGGSFSLVSYNTVKTGAPPEETYTATMVLRYTNNTTESFIGTTIVRTAGPQSATFTYSDFPVPYQYPSGVGGPFNLLNGVSTTENGVLDTSGIGTQPIPDSGTPSDQQIDWAEAVIEAKERRVAWFKKNCDTTINNLKIGTLPGKWDFVLKRNAPVSSKTYRPVLLEESHEDSVHLNDDHTITVTTRTVTFTYELDVEQPDGSVASETRTETIQGTWTREIKRHEHPSGSANVMVNLDTYVDYYIPYPPNGVPTGSFADGNVEGAPYGGAAAIKNLLHQYLVDKSNFGLGLVWNGVVQLGPSNTARHPDSTWGFPVKPIDYLGYNPPVPPYSNTMVGTAPDFIKTYHQDVRPKYDFAGEDLGSTEWNMSALIDKETVTLMPFGLVKDGNSLGMFAHVDDARGATEVEVYGVATLVYDDANGIFTLRSWRGLKDVDGNDVDSRRGPLVVAVTPTTNCVAKYGPLAWEDTIAAARETTAALSDPQSDEQKLMKAVLEALKPV